MGLPVANVVERQGGFVAGGFDTKDKHGGRVYSIFGEALKQKIRVMMEDVSIGSSAFLSPP